ncbi:alcohol dehydrogenase catalytic domain-containing protein, partial [Cribrihabitans sp. XS_ASV171]
MTDLPETMFAVIQTGDGYSGKATGPAIDDAANWLEAAEIPVPTPGDGEVLIRVRMASVNPSDLHSSNGEYGQPRVKGAPAGFEGCGDVVAAGKGAEGMMGQRVAFYATKSGAWADYALTDARAC